MQIHKPYPNNVYHAPSWQTKIAVLGLMAASENLHSRSNVYLDTSKFVVGSSGQLSIIIDFCYWTCWVEEVLQLLKPNA